jgi:aminocarboxymuconate-semialdehyde decarboxylase
VRVSDDGGTAEVIIEDRVFRVIRSAAWDFGRRPEEMAASGTAMQVVSPMPELFSYWAPSADGVRHCAQVNRWIAQRVATNPHLFRGLGILPLQDPSAAVDLVDDVARLGLLGVEVGTNVNQVCIADPRFRPVFDAVANRGLLVLVHAFRPEGRGSVSYGPAVPAVHLPLEVSRALESFIANGLVAARPDLKLIMSHGGGAATFVLGRLQRLWDSDANFRHRLPIAPYECARRVVYDTLLFEPRALEYLVSFVGPSQVVTGSDYPFSNVRPGELLAECTELDAASRTAIEWQNASKLIAGVPALTTLGGQS